MEFLKNEHFQTFLQEVKINESSSYFHTKYYQLLFLAIGSLINKLHNEMPLKYRLT